MRLALLASVAAVIGLGAWLVHELPDVIDAVNREHRRPR